MDALELMDRLAKSPFVGSEISFQMQLGLPKLKKMGGELCICFRPHKEEYQAGKLCFFPAQYEIVWAYPFNHVVLFRNLAYTNEISAEEPLHTVDADWMLDIGRHYMRELYDACSEVLSFREEYGKVNETVLRKYQKTWENTVRQLGLGALYGKST